uniref:TNFR-Cys domain-containing protein n=1 Tax=Seriola lalandi dorsalis TaxID=1841481 RepID=A0A3B4YIH1_SERLL
MNETVVHISVTLINFTFKINTFSLYKKILHEIKLLVFFSTGNRVRTDCTEFRSTSCLPCMEGTFVNHPTGLKQCFPCTNCDPGSGLRIKSSCTTTSDAVCEAQGGFYCTDSTKNSCVAAEKHTRCQPGQYISQKGTASKDTVCSDCRDATFSDGTFTSCQPHTQ